MIRKVFDANVSLIKHMVLIPLKLLFVITVYIPFVKLPVLIPAKFLFDLETDWQADILILWLSSQLELLVLSCIHFVMVNVFLGIIVGLLTGFNLKAIRYVLTWKPKSKIKKKPPKWARQSRRFVLELALSNVVVEENPQAKRTPLLEDIGLSQLPAPKLMIVTLLLQFDLTNNMRQRTLGKSLPNRASALTLEYEDDDGYSAYISMLLDSLSLPAIDSANLPLSSTRRSSLHNIDEVEEEEFKENASHVLDKVENLAIATNKKLASKQPADGITT